MVYLAYSSQHSGDKATDSPEAAVSSAMRLNKAKISTLQLYCSGHQGVLLGQGTSCANAHPAFVPCTRKKMVVLSAWLRKCVNSFKQWSVMLVPGHRAKPGDPQQSSIQAGECSASMHSGCCCSAFLAHVPEGMTGAVHPQALTSFQLPLGCLALLLAAHSHILLKRKGACF